MTTYKKNTRTAAIVIAVLLLSLTGFLWYKDNKAYKKQTEIERLRLDSLNSEKLLLNKEINTMATSILAWKNKNESLDSALQTANRSVAEKVKIINALRVENLTVKRLRKELKDLKKIHTKLEAKMTEVLAENKQLKNKVTRLKEELVEKSKPEKMETIFSLDNFKIALEKKNTKLTIKAKKIKTIQINFEIKNNQKEATNEDLYIVVKDADSKTLGSKTHSAIINGEKIVYADNQKVNVGESPKKISITVKMDAKLKTKGTLKIMVYSTNKGLIGTFLSPVI